MKIHVKTYMDHFGYGIDDIILCEFCTKVSVDIHHIHAKQMGGRKTFEHNGKTYDINDINNLIALCRNDHDKAHYLIKDDILTKGQLWLRHQYTLSGREMN